MSMHRRWSLCFFVFALLGMAPGVMAAVEQDVVALWSDFNHYVRIAKPELAIANANLLLKVDGQALLDVVEGSEYQDYDLTLLRASKTEGLEAGAKQLMDMIQGARIKRSRDPARIGADIRKLAGGSRENLNATERLRAAGQFAAPLMLKALLDEKEKSLHPYLLSAMVAVGRPMVDPLSIALPDLEAKQQRMVCQVLGEIGYPRALPEIKQVIEDSKTGADIRAVFQTAFNQLAKGTGAPETMGAAELHLQIGRNYYSINGNTDGESDTAWEARESIVWDYHKDVGLIPTAVPRVVYGDVKAMRAAAAALSLNPGLDQALSLWLMSNLRRENRLAKDATDPSYSSRLQSPAYYLMIAGPERQLDVLAKAMEDRDVVLAVQALDALSVTAGRDDLISDQDRAQPILRALYSLDRRVRFRAALVLANARPNKSFPGSEQIVRLLAEAVRQSEQKYVAIVAGDQEVGNQLQSFAKKLGYQSLVTDSAGTLRSRIDTVAGVDLLVVTATADGYDQFDQQVRDDLRLAAAAVVVVASATDQIEINRRHDQQVKRPEVVVSVDSGSFEAAVDRAIRATIGTPITAEETTRSSSLALEALREVALSNSSILNIQDAAPALIRSLGDSRPAVVKHAAGVLAMIDLPDAQGAIADAAFEKNRDEEVRISLLESLSRSAANHKNHLSGEQLEKIRSLVKSSKGPLAVAAAGAHGALTLPASDVLKMIQQ